MPPRPRRGKSGRDLHRLKRVAADFKDDVRKHRMPKPSAKNGKRIALVMAVPPRSQSRAIARSAITAPCSIPTRRRAA